MRKFTDCCSRPQVATARVSKRLPLRWRARAVQVLVATALMLSISATGARADGLIIPAYLPLGDATNWNVLKEDAAFARDGSSARYKDYWVAVNSGDNGPFSSANDWALAKVRWDPIRANGGAIFGYVHTLTSPTSSTFRPLADVKADINAWAAGYEGLGGIWLDEFYPRYEIDSAAGGASPAFPNGQSNAPTDRSFLNADGTYKTNYPEINPAGGYYSQLTSWIRAAHPNLKIIGNAGGKFYSNQNRYADLVDVTCSFEETLAVAANAPANDWAKLDRAPATLDNPQLALIHTNSTDLAGAINQSISHGYRYFYTTDRTLNNNIWGGLPPYFTSQVLAVYK